MTDLEKSSKRKAKAIRYLVDDGEYSPGYALDKLEALHDEGKILDIDYEPLAEYLEELMDNTHEENLEIIEEETEHSEENDSNEGSENEN